MLLGTDLDSWHNKTIMVLLMTINLPFTIQSMFCGRLLQLWWGQTYSHIIGIKTSTLIPVRATPAIFLLIPVEASKGSRVLSMPQDLGITGEWNATSAPMNCGGSCAGRNRKKEPCLTRDWDQFRLGPALPSSA